MRTLCVSLALSVAVMTAMHAPAQQTALTTKVNVRMRLEFPQSRKQFRDPPAVMWLKPLQPTAPEPFPSHGPYTLMQKNRTFIPHLLVVPVGSKVLFPNRDPFFHNVFSLFEGQRFDLGLYEAGSTKELTFSRAGVSYIFCNIHPEMSAVVLALSTPYYAIADTNGTFQIRDVPVGEYELHVWVEGLQRPELGRLVHSVHLTASRGDLGKLVVTALPQVPATHLNKFGQPYWRDTKPTY